MNQQLVFKRLAKQMPKYQQLKQVAAGESAELFSTLPKTGQKVIGRYQTTFNDMEKDLPLIKVRKTVKEKLELADLILKKIRPQAQLLVSYGYRSPKIQESFFKEIKEKMRNEFKKEIDLIEAVHLLIAVPEVAGHPTGGAVDLTILENGEQLNMGSKIYDFDDQNIFTFSPFISEEEKENRQLLRTIMLEQGFAPFDGEWWHFSYGDKEWAYYYQQEKAIYGSQNIL